MNELIEMIKLFRQEYSTAPLYGSYSRTLRRRIEGKAQVQSAFIENLLMLSKVTDEDAVSDKIDKILKRFE
jgi:hypothetical protein